MGRPETAAHTGVNWVPGFDFFLGGIEDGIIGALTQATAVAHGGYAKTIAPYSGQMDSEMLRKALSDLLPSMPMFLIAYADGKDVESPALARLPNSLRVFKHECTFTVIAVSDDARGETQRRRGTTNAAQPGVYKMVADVHATLDCIQFKKTDPATSLPVLLTLDPLQPAGLEYLARLPDLTAYAVHYDTYFKYVVEPPAPGPLVQELIFEVDGQEQFGTTVPGEPGVIKR